MNKKMNKRECVAYIKAQQEKMWEAPTSYDKRTETYKHCETVCRQNGYGGECFVQLWNAATREIATKEGIYRG